MKIKMNELNPDELRVECDPASLEFETTADISSEPEIIGQDRAVKAIDFGLNVDSEGFNLYISGIPGTGRNSAILEAVKKVAAAKKVPDDICYLYNFFKPDEPKYAKLPSGVGCSFQQDMDLLLTDLEKEIMKAFQTEDYEKHKKAAVNKFEALKDELDSELGEFVKSKGFTLQQTLTGLVAVPVYKGHPIKGKEYEDLSEEEKSRMKRDEDEVYEKLYDLSHKMRELDREIKNEMKEFDKKVGDYAIGHLIADIKKKYAKHPEILKHLDEIRDDILKNLDILRKEPEAREMPFLPAFSPKEKEATLNKYKVNLVIDNCKAQGAPVVVETNPTYYNVTGYVEYKAQFGVLTTDFTMIKAGSALKANGGFLIVQAQQLLMDYFAWDSLKKILRYKQVKIENVAEHYGFTPTTGLKPEAVPVDLKVIMVGNPVFYHLLYIYDEEFRRLFKVKADFDTSAKKSGDFLKHYALLIARKCKDENTLPFRRDAVAKIIDYGSRLTSHKEKISTRFLEIADMIRQADYWARKDNAKVVEAKHVKAALEEKVYRSDMVEKKVQDLFEEGTIFVDTDGAEAGQINGISVVDLGDYMFGMPSRITASTFLGKGNIINIEREAKMSGRIHSKGVLILSGYLGRKFAQGKPLALSASIGFEQVYEEVEGDSASSAELYCLLSSLSGLPLRQDIAVTGSVNQRGQIQPIGGVNEKVEGFYAICKIKGLTGKQGVMIPKSNVKHLMLKDEIVEAVRVKRFHIYPVETIEEGLEILTGITAGEPQADGKYPKGTVFYKVDERLSSYAKLAEKPEK